MDDSPEVIRHQMEETRASLTDKLEQLEHQVFETVKDARSAVTETVDTVKDAMHETVETVKDTFDLELQMRRHPWAILGGSIALGFLGGRLLERSRPEGPRAGDWPHTPHWSHGPFAGGPNGASHAPQNGESSSPSKNGSSSPDSGLLSSLTSQFGPELDRLKGMAVGAALGVVRDLISQSIPEPMKPQVADVMDSITVKLGGSPVRGSLLSTGDDNEKSNPAKMGRSMGPT